MIFDSILTARKLPDMKKHAFCLRLLVSVTLGAIHNLSYAWRFYCS